MTGQTPGPEPGENREAVAALRNADPHLKAAEIAARLGITRQRVYQHLTALGMPTRALPRSGETRRRCPENGMNAVPPLRTGGVPVKMRTIVAGMVGELLAAADLMARGWVVYAPVGRYGYHADLIATPPKEGWRPVTFEVRPGARKADGRIVFKQTTGCKADHYAVVLTGEPVLYVPPLPGFGETAEPAPDPADDPNWQPPEGAGSGST